MQSQNMTVRSALQYQDAIMQVCTFPRGSMWICNKTFPNTSKNLYWPLILTCNSKKVLSWQACCCEGASTAVIGATNIDNRDLRPCHCNKSKSTVEGKKRSGRSDLWKHGDQSSAGDVISVAYHNHFLWSILRPQNYSFCAWQSLLPLSFCKSCIYFNRF